MTSAAQPYLLDTPLLLHLTRRSTLGQWALDEYDLMEAANQPLVSVVSVGELYAFAVRLGWGHARRQRLEEVLRRALSVPLDFPGVIDSYAQIDAHCRLMGTPIGENDTWIAATASATGARLITTDLDFDRLTPTFLERDWIDPRAHR